MLEEHEEDPCIVCTKQQALTVKPDFDGIHQKCPRCGEFKVSGTALAVMGQGLGAEKRAKLSGWVWEQNRASAIPMITSDNLNNILARPRPSVGERATNLLIEAEHGLTNLGDSFNINDPRFMAATYSSNPQDVEFLLKVLSGHDLAKATAMGGQSEILSDGYFQLDEMKKQISTSSQGFVAMWFNEELNETYSNGFQKGIFQAGYDPLRIDRVEHINRIDDEIIGQIKASKFVVADFTGHRGGVYFEAGFALGLDMPVFWTCRSDHMDDLHFDIRQFNCIDWKTPEDLADRLTVRLEAVLGPGPNK